jgi:chromosome segregation ATPase
MFLCNMKSRIGVILLVIVSLGLGIWLVVSKKQASQEIQQHIETNVGLSNDLAQTRENLSRQQQVNTELEGDRVKRKADYEQLSNNFTQVTADLSKTSATLTKTEADLKASQEETAKRDAKIADLEAQNQALDKRALDLSTAITNLTQQIEETKRKLAASEGEKGFLEGELKRLVAEKAELERQFNDLKILRAQVAKLKEELTVARRLDWIRRGLFASTDEKGAQRLMQTSTATQPKGPATNYDLNVEVRSDGSVKVLPPLTNSPAATNPPAK